MTHTDIPSLLLQARHETRPALSFYRGKVLVGRLGYGELAARVELLAAALHARGVRRGSRVAMLTHNRLEVPPAVLALMRLGAAVVPLNPASAPEDWAYVLDHSKAAGVLTTADLASRVPSGPRFTMLLEDEVAVEGPAPPVDGSLADEVAVVLYTSGTTGQPKGVALRQRNLLANARSMAENFRLDGTVQLAVLPLYHAHAFGFGLMTALTTRGHLVFTERLEPFTWADVVRAEDVTVTSVVPTMLPMLLAARVTRDKVPGLQHLLVSSAPLSATLARQAEAQLGVPLTQGWGLSEYTNFACCLDPFATPASHASALFDDEVPSIGPALRGTEVRIVDAHGAVVDEGARGELCVRGHSTMLGYLDDEAATQRTIDAEGWLSTGDEGYFRRSGGVPFFYVTGRLKEIIIRDAEKYSPLKLEAQLLAAVPELAGRLVVLGVPHPSHGEEVGAYIEHDAGLPLADEVVTRLLAAIERMPLPERPKLVLHGDAPIPRTHTGKIQRRKLLPLFAALPPSRGATKLVAV